MEELVTVDGFDTVELTEAAGAGVAVAGLLATAETGGLTEAAAAGADAAGPAAPCVAFFMPHSRHVSGLNA